MDEQEGLRRTAAAGQVPPKRPVPWNWPKAVTVIAGGLILLGCVSGAAGWLPWQ